VIDREMRCRKPASLGLIPDINRYGKNLMPEPIAEVHSDRLSGSHSCSLPALSW
jgi:hypothetical protein